MNTKVDVKYEMIDENIILKLYFKETNKVPYDLEIKNENDETLHQQKIGIISDSHINNDFHFYFIISNKSFEIKIKIYENDYVIYTETILLRNKYGILIDQPTVLIFAHHLGLGDCLWANATIKKLYNSFSRKIDVITRYPELLINNPYVNRVEKIDRNFDNRNLVLEKYKLNKNFYEIFAYTTDKWGTIDLRETAAFNCGFHLLPNERQIEFFANKFIDIPELPSKYVVLNPRIAGVDRDLGQEKWQKLIDILNNNSINVVLIGVKNSNGDPEYHQLNVKHGINLCGLECQSNLSQTWHIINKSNCFVTFDTGMYILSGTTNAQLFMIGWYSEPHWHKPFRNGSYDYKLKIIDGECKENCINTLKYYIKQHARLYQPLVQSCALNYNEFKCIPTVEKIANDIIQYYKNS